MYGTETDRRSNIWIALGTESKNQLLPHHKSLNCIWLSHNTTNKADRTADKPTMMDITQHTAVAQPPGLHGLQLYRTCKLWLQIKHTCNEQVVQKFWLHFLLFFYQCLSSVYSNKKMIQKGVWEWEFQPRLTHSFQTVCIFSILLRSISFDYFLY